MVCLKDTKMFRDVAKWKLAICVTMLNFLFGIMYASDAGLFFLEVIDFYINFVMLIIAFFESFAFGWVYGIEKQIEEFGLATVFTYMFANFGGVLFACAFWFGLKSAWAGFVALFGFYGVFLAITYFIKTGEGTMIDLAFGNVLDFKK